MSLPEFIKIRGRRWRVTSSGRTVTVWLHSPTWAVGATIDEWAALRAGTIPEPDAATLEKWWQDALNRAVEAARLKKRSSPKRRTFR